MTKEEVKKWVDAQKGDCIEKDNNSIIKFEENHKKFCSLITQKKSITGFKLMDVSLPREFDVIVYCLIQKMEELSMLS